MMGASNTVQIHLDLLWALCGRVPCMTPWEDTLNGELNQDVCICLREGLKHRESGREIGNEDSSNKSSLCVISQWKLL